MRINGLVRFFNHVRSQLQTGLAPHEIEPFKQQVRKIVREVEAICRHHGAGIESLPAPSRRAYVFLRDLDLDNLPRRQAGEPAAAKPGFRIKNVVKIGESFADRIWQRLDPLLTVPADRAQLTSELERQVASIEKLCAKYGHTPAILEAPSRRVYCWMKFLTSADQLSAHLEALQLARDIAREQPLPAGRPLLLHLANMNLLWRRREYRNALLLKVHQGFQNADRQVWRALLECALTRHSSSGGQLFREFAESEEFSEVLFEMESFAAPPAPPVPLARGRAHGLDESFARVNAAYFDGQMPKPTLVWNRTLTAHKFAHYQPNRDTVMMSVTLDDPSVPASVVDFVMYHELLHKKHGSMIVNGRRLAHSPAFRAEERRFAGYDEAERQLKSLAMRQHGAGGFGGDDGDE
ncbi:MAG: hypothetical protein ACREEM_15710 [Blastocatellia bacterium]